MDSLDLLTPPTPLLRYVALSSRKPLSPVDKRRYTQLQKGFAGEQRLQSILQTEHYENIYPLYNCLFEVLDQEFEIDCLLLTSDTIFLLEVKNYTGNYYIENNQIHHLPSKRQIYNPVTQIDRTEFLFKRLLSDMQINLQVRSFVLFVNYNFVLYEASLQLPIIFPSQIKSFLDKTNRNASVLTNNVKQLGKILIRRRKSKSLYERSPTFNMEELKKAVYCQTCLAELVRHNQGSFTCSNCGQTENARSILLRSVAQYHLLFPESKITTNNIFEWCGRQLSKSYIRNVLTDQFIKKSVGRHTHYHFRKENSHLEILHKSYLSESGINILKTK